MNFTITQAHIDDRPPLKNKCFSDKVYEKLYADKCDMGKNLMQLNFVDGFY